jgi:uncharacterized protein (DUF433 family)
MKTRSFVNSDPDILGGTPVFVGTRVPVQALIDYLEGGHSLAEFLDDFPTVTRELAIKALKQAKADEAMPSGDPIVDEVRRVRDEHAARFNYDLRAIFADLRRSEQARDPKLHPLVSPPKPGPSHSRR